MNLEVLRSFLTVSKYKSMSKAADALYITQPTLSSRIKNLENQFNVKLFNRDWQGVQLTKYGLFLLPHAIDMLSKLENFISVTENFKDLNDESLLHSIETMNDTLRIGINDYVTVECTEKMIDLLVTEYPSVQFEFLTESTANLLELMDYNAVDMILYYSEQDMNRPMTRLVGLDHMVFIFNEADYHLVRTDITKLKDINKPLYLNSNPLLKTYLHHFQHMIYFLQITQYQMVDNWNLMKQLIEANQGYAALPEFVWKTHFNSPQLYAYKLPHDLPSLSLYMTCNESSQFKKITDHIYKTLVGKTLLEQH